MRLRKKKTYTPSQGGMNLASLWDFVDNASEQRALLVAVKGHHGLAVTRLLAERASLKFPQAKVAAASEGEVAWESFQGGVTTPISPYRAIDRFIGLEGGRSEEDTRQGYDLVFRYGTSSDPDVRITLNPSGSYSIETAREVNNGKFLTPMRNEADRMHNTPFAEIDPLLEALGLEVAFGSGAIPATRHIEPVEDPTENEKAICNRLLAWSWFLVAPTEVVEDNLQQDISSLLREKLTPSQVETVKTLLYDARYRADFFSVVAIAKAL